MDKPDKNTERKEFDKYIHAISIEIEQAQVKLISAANVQMLLHYWKLGYFILYNQKRLGWGSKFIEQTSKALQKLHPEKKGYSPRNLKYMCQFAKAYSLDVLNQFHWADQELEIPTIEKVLSTTNALNGAKFGQEALAQIQTTNIEGNIITQEVPAQMNNITETLSTLTHQTVNQIENYFIYSPVSKINWASHVILMDSKLPLGSRYWYMKQ
ncbi:MAG: DUF1016 N-terminal domain-containing protein, partial [Tannerellaceae bacterium]|nr:DUF1016 N-terminal domain-containing protein [Tannerellaceae bacterium]